MEPIVVFQVISFLALLALVSYLVYSSITATVEQEEEVSKVEEKILHKIDDTSSMRILSGVTIDELGSDGGEYRLSIQNGKLVFYYLDTEKWSIDIPLGGKLLGANRRGQLLVLDENEKEVFKYPEIPPFEEERSVNILIDDNGDLFLMGDEGKKIILKSFESSPEPAPIQSQEPQYSVFLNTDYVGNDIGIGNIGSLESCKKSCDENPQCNAFVIDQKEHKHRCWLKNLPLDAKPSYDVTWSTYYKGTPPTAGQATLPTQIQYEPHDFVQFTGTDTDLAGQPITSTLSGCIEACESDNTCIGFSREKSKSDTENSFCYLKKSYPSPSFENQYWKTFTKPGTVYPTSGAAVKPV